MWFKTQYDIPTRMVIIKRQVITSVAKDVGKLEPLCTAGGNIKWCLLWKTIWQFFKSSNIELPVDPAIALLGLDAN